ncbi:TorD/DmsD family molecular chaperone [Hydrogenimonas sp.]
MDDKTRLYIYAFLSRVFTEELDDKALKDLAQNEALLATIGEETLAWFQANDTDVLKEELNVDYNSLFVIHNHPIESSVMDSKNEILVGLQNPVMQFYFSHGYDLNLEGSKLYVPDHAGIEFGFMQSLVSQQDRKAQAEFLHRHLVQWIVPFLVAVKPMAQTPFYRDLCDFAVEFLLSDYSELSGELEGADAR